MTTTTTDRVTAKLDPADQIRAHRHGVVWNGLGASAFLVLAILAMTPINRDAHIELVLLLVAALLFLTSWCLRDFIRECRFLRAAHRAAAAKRAAEAEARKPVAQLEAAQESSKTAA
jgi:hypothetical protein